MSHNATLDKLSALLTLAPHVTKDMLTPSLTVDAAHLAKHHYTDILIQCSK